MEILKSCNYCKSQSSCPAKSEIETRLIIELPFINRITLLSSTKFWQAIAENCEVYVISKE